MPSLLRLFTKTHHQRHHSPSNNKHVQPQTLSATLMEDNILGAESIISKWVANPTPLFYGTRHDAARFCHAIHDLYRAMVFFSSNECLASPKVQSDSLLRSQSLMRMAMERLEKEFYRILSGNRDRLDIDLSFNISNLDSKDDIKKIGEPIGEVESDPDIVTADLRTIAETMILAGYGKECVKVYNKTRKSIVDEGLFHLGFERLSLSQIQKLDSDVLHLKIRSWLNGFSVAVQTLLSGERMLCDHVFEGSDPIRESCFAEITKEAAVQLLVFPELIAKSRRSPKKLFWILDLYNALSDLLIDIESVFSCKSTETIRSQALCTLSKLGEAARSMIIEFDSTIQKDGSKNPTLGGGVHPITRYVMNYLVSLADYDLALANILANFSIQELSPLPESFFDLLSSSPTELLPLSIRIAWLILSLLCKLDSKAETFRDVMLSYLFLANNLQFVIKKVKESRLRLLLGDNWVLKHDAKVKYYASSYERLGWARIASAIPASDSSPTIVEEKIRAFYAMFEEAVRVQREWVVEDEKMREDLRELVAEMIVPVYRGFYDVYRPIFAGVVSRDAAVVRYAPEDVRARVMELFSGTCGSDSDSGSGSSLDSGSDKSSLWSFRN